jgi:hypothetical protein
MTALIIFGIAFFLVGSILTPSGDREGTHSGQSSPDSYSPRRQAPFRRTTNHHGTGNTRNTYQTRNDGRTFSTSTPLYKGKTHLVLNSEGEVYSIDTSDSRAFFYGSAWDKVLSALSEGDYVKGKALLRRRDKNNYFSGYEIKIEGITAFLPRSKCGYFWNEETDASSKNIIVKPFQLYPTGSRRGTLLVDASAPILELDRHNQKEWAIGIDFDQESFYFTTGKNLIYRCSHQELLDNCPAISRFDNLREATGRYYRIKVQNERKAVPVAILE